MFFNRPHLAQRTLQFFACAALGLGLSGCQSISGTSLFTQVRFIDASPDAPSLDFYENSTAVIYGTFFGISSSYIPINAGVYNFSVDVTKTSQQLATIKATLASGGQYTVIAGNVAAALQMTVLQDQTTPAAAGQVEFRFVDQATRTGAVDIYVLPSGSSLNAVLPLITNVSFNNTPTYVTAPAGTYSIIIVPTGTVPSGTTSSLFTGAQVQYPSSSVRTVVLLDQQLITSPGIQIVSLDDYDTP